MFSFVDSTDVAITGSLTLRNGGWFTMIFTNCDGVHLSGFDLRADRDGIDLMQSRNVLVENINMYGGADDALKFGSDYSRGREIASYNVHVRDSSIGSDAVDAIVIGTETVGDFYNFTFENLTLTGGMSGIGLTSYDGANIHDLLFTNIKMRDLASPFFFAIYARLRRPPDVLKSRDSGVGSISNITLQSIFAENLIANNTPSSSASGHYSVAVGMVNGMPKNAVELIFKDHPVGPGILFRDVELHFPGRGQVAPACLPGDVKTKKYPMGDVPAYGAYLRRARGVQLENVSVRLPPAVADSRPAIVIEEAEAVQLQDVTVDRSDGSGYDIEVRHCQSIDVSPELVVAEDPCDESGTISVV